MLRNLLQRFWVQNLLNGRFFACRGEEEHTRITRYGRCAFADHHHRRAAVMGGECPESMYTSASWRRRPTVSSAGAVRSIAIQAEEGMQKRI